MEWQADTLGAAILMPQEDVERAMWYFTSGGTLRRYKKKFWGSNLETLEMFCKQFEVSRTAALIRLNQFGYIEDCEEDEWIDLPGVF